ncbi:lipopolysaccharide biosynthesis protein [Homoserinibacter sp. YIM 151385]|uniref:lipopolysaccharide biosynthesis protein n=1 Tax=Homoserinibacter sp. YIM 151385 TaxID=2985506 RepID=UPI0022F0C6A5|nr:lipopolysaccharide biosynthesis protein [Homoserinibacter sp. YIM 151385]WBU38832.1 lipopolysaccharide biosynthesis protein [Homoserinibacter sp. YIM 151385]
MPERRESLARGGLTSLVGSAVAALAALALAVVLGNGAGAEGTGRFFQAVAVFTVITQALKLGTNSAIVRVVAEQRAVGARGELWRTALVAVLPVLVASALTGLAVWLAAEQLAGALGGDGRLAELLRILAPYLVIAAAMGVLHTVTRMVNGVAAFTLLQSVLLPLARLGAVLAALALGLGSQTAVAAWLAPVPLVLLVTIALLVRPLLRDWRERRAARGSTGAHAREFWRFSSARGVGAALETAAEWADVLLVAAIASPAAAGVYAVVTRSVRAGQVVDRAMRIAVAPRISTLLALGDVAEASRLHTAVTRVMILMAWPFYLGLAVFAPAVLAVFGPEFAAGAGVLAVIAVAAMVQSSTGMLQSVLLQGGHASWQLGNKAAALAVAVAANLALLPLIGLWGAAIAWTAAMLVDLGLAAWQVHRRMRVRLEPGRLLLPAAIPLVLVGGPGLLLGPLVGASPWRALLALAALAVPYLLVLWLLRRRLGLDRVLHSLLGRRDRDTADGGGIPPEPSAPAAVGEDPADAPTKPPSALAARQG